MPARACNPRHHSSVHADSNHQSDYSRHSATNRNCCNQAITPSTTQDCPIGGAEWNGDLTSIDPVPRSFRVANSSQHRNWPQQLRLEEPARKGRQDDRRETDHGGIDQQARIADHPGLEKPVAHEKQDMSDGSGDERHAHDLAAVRSANRAGVNDPEGQRNKQDGALHRPVL